MSAPDSVDLLYDRGPEAGPTPHKMPEIDEAMLRVLSKLHPDEQGLLRDLLNMALSNNQPWRRRATGFSIALDKQAESKRKEEGQ